MGLGTRRRPFITLAVVLCAGCLQAIASGVVEAQTVVQIGSAVMPSVPVPGVSAPQISASETVRLALPPLSSEERRKQQRMQAGKGPLRLALGRGLRESARAQGPGQRPGWHPTSGGHVRAWRVKSPGAVGLRLALRPRRLPDDALFWVAASDQPPGRPILATEINASIRRNRDAGGDDDAAGLFWLPLVVGDTLTLQVELPANVQPDDTWLDLVRVSHFFRLPFLESSANAPAAPDEETDPACAEQWDGPSRATTMLLYTHPHGATGACTGTLLNDSDPQTFTPYLLTAHHCFPDQIRASSIESLWFVRAETCGGDRASYATVSGGADLLYQAKSTDTALLRLRRSPPAGAVFTGWDAALPAKGDEVAGIHHPAGNRQQRTLGKVGEYKTCVEVAWCGKDADPAAISYIKVNRLSGGTKPGSSGSGLFNMSQQLVGTHLGGSDAASFDYYGRFDRPYRESLVRWLGGGRSGE